MTTRSQKRKAVTELVSGEVEAFVAENIQSETLVSDPSKTLTVEPENLDEIKTPLRKKIMSDLVEMLAENQKEMVKLTELLSKKQPVHPNNQDSDSESENISVARTSAPVKTNTAAPETIPINNCNTCFKNLLHSKGRE